MFVMGRVKADGLLMNMEKMIGDVNMAAAQDKGKGNEKAWIFDRFGERIILETKGGVKMTSF